MTTDTADGEQYRERFERLFKMMGCVRMKSGKYNPFTVEGVSHFGNCPKAPGFRK